jgi:CrcB protein
MDVLTVGIGGALGAIARFLISGPLSAGLSALTGWPFVYGTAIVNILGSFLIGLFLEATVEWLRPGSTLHLLVTVGFFGGFTTFSSFSAENVAFLRRGEWLQFGAHAFGTTALCILAALAGVWLGGRLAQR